MSEPAPSVRRSLGGGGEDTISDHSPAHFSLTESQLHTTNFTGGSDTQLVVTESLLQHSSVWISLNAEISHDVMTTMWHVTENDGTLVTSVTN